MIIDSYDINSEPIVKLENFYGEKQHLVKKCMVIFSKVIYEYMLEKFPCRQEEQAFLASLAKKQTT